MSDVIKTKHSFVLGKDYGLIFFCRFCHERNKILHDPICDEEKEENLDDIFGNKIICSSSHNNSGQSAYVNQKNGDITCPSCNNISLKDEIFNGGYTKAEDRIVYNGMSFFDNGDTVRVYMNYKEINFFNKKIQQFHISVMAVFNISTGHSYLFEPRYKGTDKRWKHYKGPRIQNISTSHGLFSKFGRDLEEEDTIKLCDLLHKKLSEKFNFPIKTMDNYREEHAGRQEYFKIAPLVYLEHIANYVRFPNVNPFFINSFISRAGDQIGIKKVRRLLGQVKHNTPSPIKDLIKAFKIPYSKSINKIVLKDMGSLISMHFFSGFKDVNNIRRAYEWADANNIYSVDKDFIDILLKDLPENVVANKIVGCSSSRLFRDTCSLHKDIILRNPEYKFDAKRSIKELHDTFTLDFNRLKHESVKINYTKKQLELNSKIDEYDFKLAKETLDMVNAGSLMNICVGTYGDRAIRKQLGIVIAYRDNHPVICIELDSSFKIVTQAKTKRNFTPKEEDLKAIVRWTQEKKLRIDTSDIQLERA